LEKVKIFYPYQEIKKLSTTPKLRSHLENHLEIRH